MVQRAALLICGIVTVLIGRVYGGLRQFAPEREMAWRSFSSALLLVGIIAVGISVRPSGGALGITVRPAELRRFTPFRLLVSFAALGLLLVAMFRIAPPGVAQP